nr:hypothetical protein [Tanacetum cinerariifolium]
MVFDLVNGVRTSGVEMICEMDFVRYVIQEIHAFMILIRILLIALPILATLHTPHTRLTRVIHMEMILILVMIVSLSPRLIMSRNQATLKTIILIHMIHRVFHNNILVVKIVGIFLKPTIVNPQYTVNHPIFNAHNDLLNANNDLLNSQNKITIAQNKLMEQLTSMCAMILACCNDDDDSAITPNEPVDSLSMGDEHLNTILATESDEFIKSYVENLVPNPSESEGESECDMPAREEFTTFSNILFNADYEFDSSDDQSCSDEDVSEKFFSNPLFEEEIIPIKIDHHHDNAESTHDSSLIFSSKIDSLLDEFAGELTLLKAIPPGIDKTDCHPENEIRLTKRLLYDNSSPRPPEEFVSENSNTEIESFSPSSIPIEDSDSFMEEIDLSFNPDDPMPPGI